MIRGFCGSSAASCPRLENDHSRSFVEPLRDSGDNLNRQAFGELIALRYAWHGDEWSRDEIDGAIRRFDGAVLTGIGFVAPHAWNTPRLREFYARALAAIAASIPAISPAAVLQFLNDSIDEPIDRETENVLRISLANEAATRALLEVMVEIAERNATRKPQLAHDIALRVTDLMGADLMVPRNTQTAQALTTIAITLHRLPAFRRAGLSLFERLIQLHVREADAALEVLDRRPTRTRGSYVPRRRYRRGRRRPRSH
jgi:hypothetical protein